MSGENFKTNARSWAGIRLQADAFRQRLGIYDEPFVDVIHVVETILDGLGIVSLEILSPAEMGGAEGATCPQGRFIRLREDVYEDACKDDARARFTIAHELGHLDLHANAPLHRLPTGTSAPHYMMTEQQANQWAAEFLMPPRFFSAHDTEMIVMARHGVSASAAEYRLDYLRRKKLI